MPDDRSEYRAAAWQRQLLLAGLAIVVFWIVAKLSPILSPFLLAAILAYICNPAVSALEGHRLPRPVGSLLVLIVVGLAVAGLVLVIMPLVQEQTARVAARIPAVIEAYHRDFSPWLKQRFGIELRLDPNELSKFATEHQEQIRAVAGNLFNSITSRGLALIGLIGSLLLVPIVMFYLLVDWNRLMTRFGEIIPRRWNARATALITEIDAVLGQFLRGQVAVMIALAIYYSLALWIAGVEFALPVGLITGLLVFIPYLGFGLGLVLAILTALMQGGGLGPLLGVAVVYGVGQIIESFFLTPYLVGERIGLHPVTVIFALLAFGQLFGFFGVLLALPASAALLVGLRAVRQDYLVSDFYTRT